MGKLIVTYKDGNKKVKNDMKTCDFREESNDILITMYDGETTIIPLENVKSVVSISKLVVLNSRKLIKDTSKINGVVNIIYNKNKSKKQKEKLHKVVNLEITDKNVIITESNDNETVRNLDEIYSITNMKSRLIWNDKKGLLSKVIEKQEA